VTEQLRIAVVGAGYWGPNSPGISGAVPDWDLVAICDLDGERAQRLADQVGGVRVVTDLDDSCSAMTSTRSRSRRRRGPTTGSHSLRSPRAARHGGEAACRHRRSAAGRWVEMAAASGLVLMADHTYCYTPAVLKIRELVEEGALGDILFIDSVRINLGLIQPDVDVFWDLAPHDLSIIDFILPGGLHPTTVSAHGADPLGAGKACIGYLVLPLANGAIAHVHVNWLSPTKIRQMVIGGTKRTLVWDDLNPQQRLSVYDRGVDLGLQTLDGAERKAATVSYRLGDTWSPALPRRRRSEAWRASSPPASGRSGLRAPTARPAFECSPCSKRPRAASVDPVPSPRSKQTAC
jgi:Predicted dehydrogenases and related proteins